MAQQTIDLGAVGTGAGGDDARTAFEKITANFVELYQQKAPLDSPALTGNPTAPTPEAADNDTSIANTAFVRAVMALFGLSNPATQAVWHAANLVKQASAADVTPGRMVTTDGLVSRVGSAGALGLRNKLINGSMDFWQRGGSFNSPLGAYTADRWRITPNSSAGVNFTVERALNHQPSFNYARKPVLRIGTLGGRSMGNATYVDIVQRIEDVGTLQGKAIVISFLHRFGVTAKNISVHVGQNFGVGGSPIVYTNADQGSVLGSSNPDGVRSIYTVTLPSIAGKTIGGASHLELLIRIYGLANEDFFDITDVQLEEGSLPTPFEHRPYGLELSLCQRFYETIPIRHVATYLASNYDSGRNVIVYATTKRTVPTLAFVNGGYFRQGYPETAALSIINNSVWGVSIRNEGTPPGTDWYVQGVADAEL